MRPTRRVAGAIGLWVVLEWYGAASEVAWLFLLAAWVLALLLATLAYAAWNRAGLSLRLLALGTRPAAGSPAEELSEHLLRRAPWPAPVFEGDALELEVGLDLAGSERGPAWVTGTVGGTVVNFGTGLVPKAGWRQPLQLTEMQRGPVDASGWQIGTSDPLGFFKGTRSCADSEVAVVLPRFASLISILTPREVEASVAAPRSGSGNELFGAREYRAGDSLRRIHWRSSARHGRLVVREYEPPGVQELTLVVDPSPPTREVADQVARIAASEAWDCIREGGRVSAGEIQSTSDLWEVLEWLARYPYVDFGESSTETVVVITADPDLLDQPALRRWLVGDAPASEDIVFRRVGTRWPL
ncbi:MAG TPA: DUF58 domain-containing protein [Candidatus Dormibacteraeota bacterium]|nr:DUF58 domain-containing protein [Candidatus Dormibacteraeota bacterium]